MSVLTCVVTLAMVAACSPDSAVLVWLTVSPWRAVSKSDVAASVAACRSMSASPVALTVSACSPLSRPAVALSVLLCSCASAPLHAHFSG